MSILNLRRGDNSKQIATTEWVRKLLAEKGIL